MLASTHPAPLPLCPPTLPVQGIAQRSTGLQAWLARHRQQLRGLRFDLPPSIHLPYCSWEEDPRAQAGTLGAVMPGLEVAVWEHRTAFASLLLSGSKLQAALAAAEGEAELASGLAQCAALEALTIWEYKGTAEALAALVAPLPSLSRLELAWAHVASAHLLRCAPPAPLTAVLQSMVLCREYYMPHDSLDQQLDIAGLGACSRLTRLDVSLGGQACAEATEQCLAQLRQAGFCFRCLPGVS